MGLLMVTLNVELLRKAVEWAEAEAARPDQCESEWNQANWAVKGSAIGRSCGTAYCIAGWVVHEANGQKTCTDYVGKASRLLGVWPIDVLGYDGLFNGENTIVELREAAQELVDMYAPGEKL